MGEQGSDAIKVWVGVVLTLFVVGVVFGIVMVARQGANTAATKVSDTTRNLSESDFTGYNGTIINGDQVIGVIKQFEGQDCVICVMGTNYNYTVNGSVNISNGTATLGTKMSAVAQANALAAATKKTSPTYIAPSNKYMGIVLRDSSTNAITGLYFQKQ